MNPSPSSYPGTFAESHLEFGIVTHFKEEKTESQGDLPEVTGV